MAAPPPRPRARRKDARPPEILEAALALFAERGFAATRLEDVATAAGISKGTIYLYFPTKEDLFRAVVRQELLPNLAQSEALVADSQGSSADLLRLLAGRFLVLLDSDVTAIPKLVVTEAGNFPAIAKFYADEVAKRGLALIGGVLQRGMDRGEFRRLDPMSVVPLFAAPFLTMVLWKHSLGRHTDLPIDPRKVIETHIELLLRGLAPDARP